VRCTSCSRTLRHPPWRANALAGSLGYGEVNQDNATWGFPPDPFGPPAPRPSNDTTRTIRTPNLARFASQSMRAFLSYTPSAECAPSRAAIMAGRSTGTMPIRGNSQVRSTGLNPNYVGPSFPLVLQAAGYRTAVIGKWGLGSAAGAPWNMGFDYFFGQLEHTEAWLWVAACFAVATRAR
jgi:arylsulfatase A-like enzyme